MNYKFKTLEWWAISIWFVIWAVISVKIIYSKPIPPINYMILIAGLCLMCYCAYFEDELFPVHSEGEEEQ